MVSVRASIERLQRFETEYLDMKRETIVMREHGQMLVRYLSSLAKDGQLSPAELAKVAAAIELFK